MKNIRINFKLNISKLFITLRISLFFRNGRKLNSNLYNKFPEFTALLLIEADIKLRPYNDIKYEEPANKLTINAENIKSLNNINSINTLLIMSAE